MTFDAKQAIKIRLSALTSNNFFILVLTICSDSVIPLSKTRVLSLIKKSILNEVKITKQKNSRWLINIGNFIVYKSNFLSTMKEGLSFSERLLFAADQFLISYLWLKNNNYIETRRQHYHFHRKRRDSISFQEKDNTEESFKTIEEKILEL